MGDRRNFENSLYGRWDVVYITSVGANNSVVRSDEMNPVLIHVTIPAVLDYLWFRLFGY